ncbi:NTP transferase domain-containing protein [bacterium]|nr:NTP transferase domain-containing protein [bacterium]
MKTGFLITARLKSSRLPKKILLEAAGKALLSHMLDRLKKAERINRIVICTSINKQDDPLEELANAEGISVYRGSEEDVLARLYEAALRYDLDFFANITADCPLIDPFFVDEVLREYEKTQADLVFFDKLPLGQGPSCIKRSALKKVCEIKIEEKTEVWRDYFVKPGCFTIHYPAVDKAFIHSTLKTSIDYPEDYEFIKEVFNSLYGNNRFFSLGDIIKLVNNKPELLRINSHCAQKGRQHILDTAKPATYSI